MICVKRLQSASPQTLVKVAEPLARQPSYAEDRSTWRVLRPTAGYAQQ